MKKKLLPVLILLRLITHDGTFLESRRNPPKPQAPEVRTAIRRTWRKGRKLFRTP